MNVDAEMPSFLGTARASLAMPGLLASVMKGQALDGA